MKKLILPIFLVLLLFSLPGDAQAQMNIDCREQYNKSMTKCLEVSTSCNRDCASVKDAGSRKACFADCSAKLSSCQDEADKVRKTCMELQQPGKSTPAGTKSISPSPLAVTTAPTSTPVSEPTSGAKAPPSPFIDIPLIIDIDEPPTFVRLIGFDTAICTPNDHQSCKISWEKILENASKRSPSITIEDEKKVSPFEPGYIGEKMRVLDSGKVQYKSAITGEWANLQSETFLPERSMVSGDWLKLRLDVGLTEKVPAVLSLSNFQAEVVPGSVELQKGEIEFKIKSWGDTIDTITKTHPVFTIKTDNAQISTKDTHFWVSYDKDKKYTLVGVYEGKVEVKTKDGKTATVTPNGDPSTDSTSSLQASSGQSEPGVAVVSQKLSPVRLAIVGIVLAAVLGCVIMILRRRFTPKGFSKKKK